MVSPRTADLVDYDSLSSISSSQDRLFMSFVDCEMEYHDGRVGEGATWPVVSLEILLS